MSIEWPLILTPTFLGSIPNFGVLVPKQLTVSTQDWGKGCNNYVCPPTCLVSAVFCFICKFAKPRAL